jgi:hypothetical protein
MDYQKELDNYPDASPEEKTELSKLAAMQKDIAIGGSAEDFVRHPFFKFFENQMNAMIADSKGEMAELLKKPGVTIGDLQAHQAGLEKIAELKRWINAKVIAKRVAEQAISIYEQDTEKMNEKIQAAVDESQKM